MLHVHQSRNKQVPLWSKLKGQTGHRICPLLVSLQVITKLKKKPSILKLIFVAWFQIQSKKVNFLSAFIVLFSRTLNVLIIGMGYITCGKGGGAYTRYLFIYFLYNRNIILPSFAFHCSVWQSQLIFGKFKTKMESLLVLTRLEMLDILQHRYTCSVISP